MIIQWSITHALNILLYTFYFIILYCIQLGISNVFSELQHVRH